MKSNKKIILSSLIVFISYIFLILVKNNDSSFHLEDVFLISTTTENLFLAYEDVEKLNQEIMLTYNFKEDYKLNHLNKSIDTTINYTNYNFLNIYNYLRISGNFFNENNFYNKDSVVVINENFAKNIFASNNIINKIVTIKEIDFKIIGIIEDGEKSNNIYIPFTFVQDKKINNLLVYYKSKTSLENKRIIQNKFINYQCLDYQDINDFIDNLYNFTVDLSYIFILICIGIFFIKYMLKKIIFLYVQKNEFYLTEIIKKNFIIILKEILLLFFIIIITYTIFHLINRNLIFLISKNNYWENFIQLNNFDLLKSTITKKALQSLFLNIIITINFLIILVRLLGNVLNK